MPGTRPQILGAVILFGVDKAAFCLALAAAKVFGFIDLSWWLVTAPVWAGWVLLWPLVRLTDELLGAFRAPSAAHRDTRRAPPAGTLPTGTLTEQASP